MTRRSRAGSAAALAALAVGAHLEVAGVTRGVVDLDDRLPAAPLEEAGGLLGLAGERLRAAGRELVDLGEDPLELVDQLGEARLLAPGGLGHEAQQRAVESDPQG